MRRAPLLNGIWLLALPFVPASGGELADRLCGADPAQRDAAVQALSGMGAEALPELREALAKPSPGGKLAAVRLLARLDVEEATAALASALALEPGIAFPAACALAEQGDARGEAVLREGLAASQPLHRIQAARALGGLRTAAAVPELIEVLRDENAEVRAAAIEALRDTTFQEFDYAWVDPLYALPADEAGRQELESISRWRSEQFDLLKEGKYVAEDGKETSNIKQKESWEAKIKQRATEKWHAFRQGYEAGQRAAREASLAQWRAWWEAHRAESPADWLKVGLGHAKPEIRSRAAAQIAQAELKEFLPALVEALRKETAVGAVAAEARAVASFRDKAMVDPLIAFLERTDLPAEALTAVDRALVDLTGIEGIPPSGKAWRAWWMQVRAFFELRRVGMAGSGGEYAVKLLKAAEGGCEVEIRRWIPDESAGSAAGKGDWLSKTFQVKAGQELGQAKVDTKDRHQLPVQVDMTPGLVLERVERAVREIRRRPLRREAIFRAVFRPSGPGWAKLTPAEQQRRLLVLEMPVS